VTSPRPEEAAALAVLGQLLGAIGVWRDDGGQDGFHDFDLRFKDRGVVAVEVTGATDPASRQFLSRVEQLDWQVDDLTQSWSINLSAAADPRRVRGQLPGLLRQLERRGVEAFDARRHEGGDGVIDQLAALQVLRGAAIGVLAGGRQRILPNTLPRIGYGSPGLANEVVAGAASREDNRRKLRAANASGARQAHLFIWVDGHNVPAAAVLRAAGLPFALPDLPTEIDAVWLAALHATPISEDTAAASPAVTISRLWFCPRGGPWQDRTPDMRSPAL
jgi:hypothetical protein